MSNSFVIEKKGQEIAFDSLFFDVEDAREHLQKCMGHSTFAMDLASRQKLSEKQIAWIHYLATQNVQELETAQEDGEFLPLVKKMYESVKTNSRKFHIHLPGVSVSTVNRGANIGCLYIFENKNYVGKITDNGILKCNVSEDVKNILLDANDNLLALAKIYGHESGVCAVCHRTLSDPLSVQMGIGPICAKRLS